MMHKLLAFTLAMVLVTLTWAQTSYQISVGPTTLLNSCYDYMISTYSDLPLQEIPTAQGGGRLAVYHARLATNQVRKIHYAYIDAGGNAISVENPWQTESVQMGFPSVAVDSISGIPFYAWHQNMDEDLQLELVLQNELSPGNDPGLYSERSIVIDPPGTPWLVESGSYIWPSVKIGPSPQVGMRRLYILSSYVSNGSFDYNCTVIVAFADFNAELIAAATPLNWQYTSIPTLQDWSNDPQVLRRLFAAFTVGNDGHLYYAGNHYAIESENNNHVSEPDIDVFVCDNYGAGTWQHYQFNSYIPLNNPRNQETGAYAFYDHGTALQDNEVFYKVCYTSHFNIVLDSSGKLHIPGNWGLMLGNSYSQEFNSLKEVVFDTQSTGFAIREIYPVADSSSDQVWWAPWDTDGDLSADHWPVLQPLPDMLPYFPFCHWDTSVQTDAMRFHYNYYRITEPDASGNMACLWQNSSKARLYHLDPEQYPEFAAYTDNAEICIAISTNQGQNWNDPVVLSAVTEPALTGMTPMWVYPSNRFTTSNTVGQQRLYLLFMDEDNWGSVSLPPPIPTSDFGRINYLALDINLPVENSDYAVPVSCVKLEQNFPNPCYGQTSFRYSLGAAGEATLELYNIRGQLLRTICRERHTAGSYLVDWDGKDEQGSILSSGIYIYKLSLGRESQMRRLLLLR